MEVADWDKGSIILIGLDMSMKPAEARKAAELGYISLPPGHKVVNKLKTIATYLYNHQKMTPAYHVNVSDGKNTLAYFLCAQYENSSPPRAGHSRPRLRLCVPKPLSHWEALYYAEVAAVRQLYEDLKQRFGDDFGGGTTPIILHNSGPNGADSLGKSPWSTLQMAAQLEEMWFTLMDQRLVAALDKAVRLKNVEQELGQVGDHDTDEDRAKAKILTEKAEGLLDINSLAPSQITRILWGKHGSGGEPNHSEQFECQSLLSACRAEIRQAASFARKSANTSSMTAFCKCAVDCDCCDHCHFQANECECAYSRAQIRDIVHEQHVTRGKIQEIDGASDDMPNNFFGAVTNDMAQMQVAAMATADPYIVHAVHTTSEAADRLDAQILQQRRARKNTDDSDLAYVPGPRTPSRGRKDNYPLDFYGGYSGQRYPKLRSEIDQNQQPPVYGASFYSANVPARKPVPARLGPERSLARGLQAPTPPASSPFDVETYAQSGQIVYSASPAVQGQIKFTQSFPVPGVANPRRAGSDVNFDYVPPAADYVRLAAEAQSITRPFSDEPVSYHAEPCKSTVRPKLATAPTAPAEGPTARATANLNLSQAHPLLPQPDFIAPRPGLKQRYVSAGGTAKLSEREEIPGPAFVQQASGAAMHKDELFQKLNDPDFIKQNFGESAVKLSLDWQRRSQESARSAHSGKDGKASYRRESEDSVNKLSGEKRQRTESGGSTSASGGRFGKLKRVFSRKNSESEEGGKDCLRDM